MLICVKFSQRHHCLQAFELSNASEADMFAVQKRYSTYNEKQSVVGDKNTEMHTTGGTNRM